MYLLLVIGFILLIKGADLFVDGSSAMAKLLRIPSVIIGLTIVAMGTSAPEAAVSITAGLKGNNDIALSNIIGSNIFNLLAVVGVCALIRAFSPDKNIVKRDFPVCIGSGILLLLFMADKNLSRVEGLIMLVLMGLYLGAMVRNALHNRTDILFGQEKPPVAKSILYILTGITAIVIGGDLVVDSASAIAAALGLTPTLIGLTIVAIGTSLPELVTSIVAARKGESGLALGNVIGSNIFNILFILGMSCGLHPIAVSQESVADLTFSIAATVLFFLLCCMRKKIGRTAGAVSVAGYLAYTAYIILR